jgi:hypothetical protein
MSHRPTKLRCPVCGTEFVHTRNTSRNNLVITQFNQEIRIMTDIKIETAKAVWVRQNRG